MLKCQLRPSGLEHIGNCGSLSENTLFEGVRIIRVMILQHLSLNTLVIKYVFFPGSDRIVS